MAPIMTFIFDKTMKYCVRTERRAKRYFYNFSIMSYYHQPLIGSTRAFFFLILTNTGRKLYISVDVFQNLSIDVIPPVSLQRYANWVCIVYPAPGSIGGPTCKCKRLNA